MRKEFRQAGLSPLEIDSLFTLASRVTAEHGFTILREDWPGSIRAERGKGLQLLPATAKTLKAELFMLFVQADGGTRFDISLNVTQPGLGVGLSKVFSDLEDEVVAMRNIFLNIYQS